MRQAQGFIDSLFRQMGLALNCPDYSTLSRRLSELRIRSPRYLAHDKARDGVHAIAIDSTGLKCFGRGEWHQAKHQLSKKASWRKLHLAVNERHYIEGCTLTDRFSHDESQVDALLAQIGQPIDHFTGDGAYDETPVYEAVTQHSPDADVVIPPRANAVLTDKSAALRRRNIQEIKEKGRMQWQQSRQYGRRNIAELAMFRYQKILGTSLHARELTRQQQEAMIGCSVLNTMTALGMPVSRRVA